MAKRLNKGLVVGLSVFGFMLVFAVAVLMVVRLQERDPSHYVKLAEQHAEKLDWKQASAFYDKAWKISTDAHFLVQQSKMFLNGGDVILARDALRRAITSQPDLVEAHVAQLEILLEIAQTSPRVESWESIRQAADDLLSRDGSNAFGLYGGGMALIRLSTQREEYAELGLKQLRDAVRLAPEVLKYSVQLAQRYFDLAEETRVANDEKAAADWRQKGEEFTQRLVDTFSAEAAEAGKVTWAEASEIRWRYAGYLAGIERDEEAARLFEESILLAEKSPDAEARVDARLAHARYLSNRWKKKYEGQSFASKVDELYTRANAILEECTRIDAKSFEPYVELASNYKRAGEFERMIAVCTSRIDQGMSRKGLEAPWEQYYTYELMVLASEGELARAVDPLNSPQQRADGLDRAQLHVDDAIAERPNLPLGLLQNGRIKLARGDDRAALEMLRRADEAWTSMGQVDWNTKMLVANLHVSLREPGAARTVLEKVTPRAPVSLGMTAFWTLYARVLYETNDLEGALNVIDQNVLSVAPTHREGLELRAALYAKLGRVAEIPNLELTDERTRLLAEAEEQRRVGDVEGMIQTLFRVLELDPADEVILPRVVQGLLIRDRGEEARQLVARALEKKPDDMVLKLLELSTRTDLTDEQRRQMRESVIRAEPNEYRRATMLAEMYYSEGSLEQVLPLLDRAEQLLLDQTTFVLDGRTSEMREHRAILSRKMLVAARLDNQEALRSAVDAATKHDVDGAGGKTFLGQYHMYREEADLAIRAFTDAITRQPTDSMALSYLGRCYQHVGRTADARTCFERALQSNPNEYLAHKGLSQLASLDEDRETAEKHLDQCERLSRSMAAYRDDAWMLTELRARAERNDPKTAITRREAELAKSPDDKDNIRRLAMLCEHVEQMDKAESYFRKLMELAPGDRTPIVALSNFFHRRERYDDALKLLEGYVQTIETPHDRANAMITVAAHHFQIGDSANVERVLLEAADLSQTFDVTRSLADYYLRQEMPRRALTWFDRAVDLAREEGSPRLADTMLSRISCLLHRRVADVATGKTRIEEFRREFPKHPDGLYWQAELQAGYGQIAEAIELLTEYIGNRPDNVVALYQRALRYVAMGQIAQAIKDLETIKTLQPAALDLQPRILLARIYEQTDRHDLALREREQMVEDVPNSQSAVAELVHAYVRREWYGDAEKLLTRVLNTVGASSPQMYMLRGEVAAKLGDVPRALADYRQGVAAAGMSAQSVMDFMGLCLRLERYEEGIRFYQEVRPKGAPESALAARYAVLLAKAGREDDAVDELRRGMAAAVVEGSASVRVIHGAVENAFPQTEDAIVRFANRPAADSVLDESNDRVLVGLLIRAGRSDEAHAKLEGLLRKATDDRLRADLVREKAMLYQMTKQYEPARQAYEEALKYDAENPLILNNLAYLLSDQLGQPQLALPYGEKAAELSDNAAVLDTLGWIQVRLGRCREAVAVLSRAVRTDPNLAILWYHLGEAYRQCAEFTVANNVLRTGMGVARLDEDPQLVDLIDSSLRRVARNDSTP